MILFTYGTRPEYIKIKPLINIFKEKAKPFKILFTGQHKDIVNGEYDYIMSMTDLTPNRLDSIVANIMTAPEFIFDEITHILIQGDTTSVMALAISAMHKKIKIIHLESGLRTYDFENPYPEEYNRRIVSSISDIHLCPTKLNAFNLFKENINKNIFVVGNTVLDNLVDFKKECEYTNKVLVTIHRRENHQTIKNWFMVINNLAIKYPEIEFIAPLHPNPNVQKYKYLLSNVTVIDPLNHIDLINILIKCKLVITDSGGLQEECSFFNKKCLVCRKVTERPESLNITTFIVPDSNKLENVFIEHIDSFEVIAESPFGDGKSAVKIYEILNKLL